MLETCPRKFSFAVQVATISCFLKNKPWITFPGLYSQLISTHQVPVLRLPHLDGGESRHISSQKGSIRTDGHSMDWIWEGLSFFHFPCVDIPHHHLAITLIRFPGLIGDFRRSGKNDDSSIIEGGDLFCIGKTCLTNDLPGTGIPTKKCYFIGFIFMPI